MCKCVVTLRVYDTWYQCKRRYKKNDSINFSLLWWCLCYETCNGKWHRDLCLFLGKFILRLYSIIKICDRSNAPNFTFVSGAFSSATVNLIVLYFVRLCRGVSDALLAALLFVWASRACSFNASKAALFAIPLGLKLYFHLPVLS